MVKERRNKFLFLNYGAAGPCAGSRSLKQAGVQKLRPVVALPAGRLCMLPIGLPQASRPALGLLWTQPCRLTTHASSRRRGGVVACHGTFRKQCMELRAAAALETSGRSCAVLPSLLPCPGSGHAESRATREVNKDAYVRPRGHLCDSRPPDSSQTKDSLRLCLRTGVIGASSSSSSSAWDACSCKKFVGMWKIPDGQTMSAHVCNRSLRILILVRLGRLFLQESFGAEDTGWTKECTCSLDDIFVAAGLLR